MVIESLTASAYRIPPNPPWEDATNKVNAIEFVVVHIETDIGLSGVGFTYTVDVGGTAIKSLIDDYLARMVVGWDPLDYEAIWYYLQRQTRRLGIGINSLAIAAVDVAIWDIIGKAHRQPLYKLLGGARTRIESYASGIDLGDSLGELLDRVDRYIDQGYRTIKIKIGKDRIEEDIERILKVKERIGSGRELLVDANQQWDAPTAIRQCSRLDGLDLGWIEEPIPYHDVSGYQQLKGSIRTPIAAGESLHGQSQFVEYLKAKAIDVVQADVAFVGGITQWMKIAYLAGAFNRPVAPHFMMELSVHLLCGVENAFMLENVFGGSLTELGVLEIPITVNDGVATPPDRPGHGIVFDAKALAKYELDPTKLQKSAVGGSK